jgi:hypothetical protein
MKQVINVDIRKGHKGVGGPGGQLPNDQYRDETAYVLIYISEKRVHNTTYK